MASMLFTVSISVSPLLTDDDDAEKLITSADNLFCASSNERRVRVEFSKNKLAMVTSRRDGTFLMGRLMTALKVSVVVKIRLMSSTVRSLIPVRFLTLSLPSIYFSLFV